MRRNHFPGHQWQGRPRQNDFPQQQQMLLSPFGQMDQLMQGSFGGSLFGANPLGSVGGGLLGGDMFGDMFGQMNRMMQQMTNPGAMMQQAGMSNPNGQMFVQSSVYSMTNDGRGAPRVYHEQSSMRQGPGGVRETRRAVRDSAKQKESMSIGHHIGERSHIIERSRNTRTGEQDQNQEFVNLDEEEAADFDREFTGRMQQGMSRDRRAIAGHRHSPYSTQRGARAIEYRPREHHVSGRPEHARDRSDNVNNHRQARGSSEDTMAGQGRVSRQSPQPE